MKKLSQSRWKVRIDNQGHPLASTCICSMGTLGHECTCAHTHPHTQTHTQRQRKREREGGYSQLDPHSQEEEEIYSFEKSTEKLWLTQSDLMSGESPWWIAQTDPASGRRLSPQRIELVSQNIPIMRLSISLSSPDPVVKRFFPAKHVFLPLTWHLSSPSFMDSILLPPHNPTSALSCSSSTWPPCLVSIKPRCSLTLPCHALVIWQTAPAGWQ